MDVLYPAGAGPLNQGFLAQPRAVVVLLHPESFDRVWTLCLGTAGNLSWATPCGQIQNPHGGTFALARPWPRP